MRTYGDQGLSWQEGLWILAEKNNILCSARFANDVKMLRPEYKSILHPIGDYQIKHGDKILNLQYLHR